MLHFTLYCESPLCKLLGRSRSTTCSFRLASLHNKYNLGGGRSSTRATANQGPDCLNQCRFHMGDIRVSPHPYDMKSLPRQQLVPESNSSLLPKLFQLLPGLHTLQPCVRLLSCLPQRLSLGLSCSTCASGKESHSHR
jgi:hypothetical protein